MPEVEHTAGSTFGGYISPVHYARYIAAYNETGAAIPAGTVVSLYTASSDTFRGIAVQPTTTSSAGVTAEEIQPGRYGAVVVSGFVWARAADSNLGSQQVSANSTVETPATVDPAKYVGEAVAYDAAKNMKLVNVRLG